MGNAFEPLVAEPLAAAPQARKVVISVDNLNHRYGSGTKSVAALQDISFVVPEGAFVSVVGPSGCGKSTLLQILAGLVQASEGDVRIDGVEVRRPQPGKIAVVFQDATLLPWKTAAENVEFPLEVQGVEKRQRSETVSSMLDLVGLSDFASRYPHELSGGMRQRVSIARGLAQDPRMILMDEPFGALDEQTRIKMGQELLRIWEKTGKTILLITHSLTEALFLSDIVLVMSRRPGRIVERMVVDLPRPRHYDIIGSPEFGSARNKIWRLLTDDESAAGQGLEDL